MFLCEFRNKFRWHIQSWLFRSSYFSKMNSCFVFKIALMLVLACLFRLCLFRVCGGSFWYCGWFTCIVMMLSPLFIKVIILFLLWVLITSLAPNQYSLILLWLSYGRNDLSILVHLVLSTVTRCCLGLTWLCRCPGICPRIFASIVLLPDGKILILVSIIYLKRVCNTSLGLCPYSLLSFNNVQL